MLKQLVGWVTRLIFLARGTSDNKRAIGYETVAEIGFAATSTCPLRISRQNLLRFICFLLATRAGPNTLVK